MYHLFIFGLCYISGIAFSFLPLHIRYSLIIIAFIGLFIFVRNWFKSRKANFLTVALYAEKLQKSEVPFFQGSILSLTEGFSPYSEEFILISFKKDDSSEVQLYTRNEYLIYKLKKLKDNVTIYFYQDFLIDIDIMTE